MKATLNKAFPGTRFTLVRDPGNRSSGFSLAALLFRLSDWMSSVQYPRWEGSFEGAEFIAVFNFNATPTVDEVCVTLYGRGTTAATAHFSKLSEQTGWQMKF